MNRIGAIRFHSSFATAAAIRLNRPLPEHMAAWQCQNFLPNLDHLRDELVLTDTRRLPVVSRPDHLLVKTIATSVNPIDMLSIQGYGSSMFQLAHMFTSRCGWMGLPDDRGVLDIPFTPGRDFVGRVMDCGDLVAGSSYGRERRDLIGRRVVGATWPVLSTAGSGALAEYVVCPKAYVTPVPENVTSVDATSIAYCGLTAWAALTDAGGMDCRSSVRVDLSSTAPTVLIVGATGGVGLVAAQLAKLWGARVHVTCREDARAQELMKSLDVEDVCRALLRCHYQHPRSFRDQQ